MTCFEAVNTLQQLQKHLKRNKKNETENVYLLSCARDLAIARTLCTITPSS